MRSRDLTPEERALWQQATRHDTKFHAGEDVEFVLSEPAMLPQEIAVPTPVVKTQRKVPQSPIRIGDAHMMDGLNARRFKRGELPVDCALDLHGYGRVEAFDALERTIRSMVARGERVLAVITGKGRGGDGVLKREVPHWLNDGAIRMHVVAATYAPQRLGGEGAVLVMLKRRRDL